MKRMISGKKKPLNVSIVIYPHCTPSMVAGFWDILSLANHLHEQQYNHKLMELSLIGADKRPISSFSGLTLTPHQTFMTKPAPDVIYVPGFIGDTDEIIQRNQSTIKWLRKINKGKTIMSAACNGNFLLAHAGVLDGQRATTHWSLTDKLGKDFRNINIEPEKILIDNGKVISAAGVTAYQNLALHIVQRLSDADIALSCAKIFLVDAGRKIQKPYRVYDFAKTHGDELIVAVQEWMENNYKEQFSLDKLSEVGRLGKKTLQRRFRKATGETPRLYLQKLRIETAKRILESDDRTFNEITWEVGYNDASSFHKAFKHETGLTPIDYRNKFAFV